MYFTQEKYASIIEWAPVGIFIINQQMMVVEVNPEGCALLGYTHEEMVGKPTKLFFNNHVVKISEEELTLLYKQEVIIKVEELLHKDGSLRYVEGSCKMLPGEDVMVITKDVTQNKLAEYELLKSNSRFEMISRTTNDAVWEWDVINEKKWCNDTYRDLFGISKKANAPGMEEWLERVHPDDRERLKQALDNVLKSDENISVEDYKFFTANEGYREFNDRVYIVRDTSGIPVRMMGSMMDITEHKKAEEQLRKTNERFQIVSKATSDIVWDWDIKSDNLWWNNNYYSQLGYKKQADIVNINQWYDNIHADDLEHVKQSVATAFNGQNSVWSCEYRYKKNSGEYLHFFDRGYIMRDGDGTAYRMIGSMFNMTPIHEAQQLAAYNENRFRAIFDSQFQMVALLDKEGKVIEANKKALEMTGFDIKEIRGKLFETIKLWENEEEKPKRIERFRGAIKKVLNGEFIRYEPRIPTADGGFEDVDFSLKPVYNEKGKIIQILIEGRSITKIKQIERELRESESKFKSFFDASLDGIILTIPYGKILAANPSACAMFGMTEDELQDADPFAVVVGPENALKRMLDERTEKGKTIGELMLQRKNGEIFPAEVSSAFFNDANGQQLASIIVRDITERKRFEQEVIQSEKKYRTLVDQADDAIILYEENGKLIDVNKGATQLLGYSKFQLTFLSLQDIMDEAELETDPIRYYPTGSSSVKKRRLKKRDGTYVVSEMRSQQLSDGLFLMIVRDLTDRIRTEQELRNSYEAVRKLSAHLQDVREEERSSISREIHDELGQQLTVLKMDVSWLSRKMINEDDAVKKRIDGLLEMLNNLVGAVRRISSELRPSVLDDLGLEAAIEWQLKEFKSRSGMQTELVISPLTVPIDKSVKTALFRIFQESLTNVARHSEATVIKVSLLQEGFNIMLTIEDNGVGFDTQKVKDVRTLGLLGMRERALMINGQYNIESKINGGTTIKVNVPLQAAN